MELEEACRSPRTGPELADAPILVSRRPPRPSHAGRLLVLVTIAFVLAVGAASTFLFVLPNTDVPAHADAIVVLGGVGPRLDKGVSLARAGVAPVLVVSTSSTGWLCPKPIPHVEIVCFKPDPSTTQGEARYVGTIARARHWNQIVVVASTPQVTRARIRIGRCYPGAIDMVRVTPGGFGTWAYAVVYEWGAMFKALVLQRGC